MVAEAVMEEQIELSVLVSEIVIDPEFGRPIVQSHARSLYDTWDEEKSGVVYVSLRADGRLICLDGYHRVAAARQKGVLELRARIYAGLTPKREAELFTAFNKARRPLKPIEIFRARLAAQEAQALAINKMVTNAGYEIKDGGKDLRGIRAVTSLDQIYQSVGAASLGEILAIFVDAWHFYEHLDHYALDGMRLFWVRYGASADRSRVVKMLSDKGAVFFTRAARQESAISPNARDIPVWWGRVLHREYNKGIRQKLGEWEHKVTGEGGRERFTARRTGLPGTRPIFT